MNEYEEIIKGQAIHATIVDIWFVILVIVAVGFIWYGATRKQD